MGRNFKLKTMKHSLTHYFLQSKLGDAPPEIVGHSQDDETKEIYHKFLDRKKAVKLMEDEKKVCAFKNDNKCVLLHVRKVVDKVNPRIEFDLNFLNSNE